MKRGTTSLGLTKCDRIGGPGASATGEVSRMKHPISVFACALVVSVAAVAPAAAYIDPGTGSMLLQMIGAGIAGAIFYFRETADQGPFHVHATRGACGRGRFRAAARRRRPLTPALASSRSFRDPDATLVEHDGRLIRAVRGHALDAFRRMLEDPVVRRWMEGRIVRTRPLARVETPPQFADFDGECFEHERIDFVSQPGEWAPEMLAAAGSLTLELARALLPRGWQLKDATPANVLFRNAEPVFVDLPSIVARDPGSCLWIARHQFETTFLLPLVASVEAGLPIAWTSQTPSRASRTRRSPASSARAAG